MTRFWNNKRRAGVVSLMVVVIVGVVASPAYAFYAEAYHGSDESIGSGRVVTVEDNECDGHRVTAEYYTVLGNFGSFSDPDGCGGDSDFRNTWDGAQLSRIRVCEIGVGCSAWKT